MDHPRIVTRNEWLAARKRHWEREREFTRLRDELSAERRNLPCVEVEKPYLFVGPSGAESLADLFAGRRQLIVYHFMLGPGWEEGCPSCSFLADHIDGALVHLAARDVSFAVVSRAPYPEIRPFQQRMGWRFKWVSSYGSDFNYDFHSTTDAAIAPVEYNYRDQEALERLGQTYHMQGEQPGASVFLRDGERVYHTYSTYGRGLDLLVGAYNYLDLVPKGRDEDALAFTMEWVRHHDKYDNAGAA
jgi:predicted dithiol-disulfide oxidoreductase (DUF899 family)